MNSNETTEELDNFDELLKEVDQTDLHHWDHWPQIKIEANMKVIGQGSLRMKRVCKLIRINESTTNEMMHKYNRIPCVDQDSRDEFYEEFIRPLEERGYHLLSLLDFIIRMECSTQIMNLPGEPETLCVGKKGQIFALLKSGFVRSRLYKKTIKIQ